MSLFVYVYYLIVYVSLVRNGGKKERKKEILEASRSQKY
jgi:hypothetical protein